MSCLILVWDCRSESIDIRGRVSRVVFYFLDISLLIIINIVRVFYVFGIVLDFGVRDR